MTADIIDGRALARSLASRLRTEAEDLRRDSIRMGIATIRIGNDFGSVAYERRLARIADEMQVPHQRLVLDGGCSQAELHRVIQDHNSDSGISGVLILRPLPAHLDEAAAFRQLATDKDIESVHPENAGLLALGTPRFLPSTAASAFHLVDAWLDLTGRDRSDFYHRSRVVVVGRSNNVGKPCVSLGYARGAAVESIDEWASRTGRLGWHTRGADVLIVAAGVPGLIQPQHVSQGAVVIDVGINPRAGADGRVHMVGDVDFDGVSRRARAISPVPGGVGPVTDVWLLHNTILAARCQVGRQPDGAVLAGLDTPLQEAR